MVGCLHTLIIVTWSLLLTNAVLIGFRKLPFHLLVSGLSTIFDRYVAGMRLRIFPLCRDDTSVESWRSLNRCG